MNLVQVKVSLVGTNNLIVIIFLKKKTKGAGSICSSVLTYVGASVLTNENAKGVPSFSLYQTLPLRIYVRNLHRTC
jgi:hypothetical protein